MITYLRLLRSRKHDLFHIIRVEVRVSCGVAVRIVVEWHRNGGAVPQSASGGGGAHFTLALTVRV